VGRRVATARGRPQNEKTLQMMIDPPITVRLERHQTALANAMNEMRAWLDNTRLQPSQFKIATIGEAGIAFDVTFRSKADASQFAQAFT
jgi:hypothetical protein